MLPSSWRVGALVVALATALSDCERRSGRDVTKNAKALTPVPGGVGPMTIACLLRNTVTASCKRRKIIEPEM